MAATVTRPAAPPDKPGASLRAAADELRACAGQWRHVQTATTIDAAKTLARDITAGNRKPFRPAGAFRGASSGLDVTAVFLATAPT